MRWFFLAVFIDGFGVPEDKEQGIKLIREAAEKGDATSMFAIGQCYLNGDGVPQDQKEALKWIQNAAEMGFQSAADMLLPPKDAKAPDIDVPFDDAGGDDLFD